MGGGELDNVVNSHAGVSGSIPSNDGKNPKVKVLQANWRGSSRV